MAPNQLLKFSSPTAARNRCCTRNQRSWSVRLIGWRSCGSADRAVPALCDTKREGSCAKAVVCGIAVSGHGEADVEMPTDGRASFDATLAKRASGARRSVAPAAGGTCRHSRSSGKIGNWNIKLRAHRPSAQCHIDRAKRRSSCCPAHQSPLQGHRAAACDALFIYSCFVPLRVPCYDVRDPWPCRLAPRSFDDRSRRPHDPLARQASAARLERASTHLTDETCAKRGVCAARKLRAREKEYAQR